MSSLFVLLSIVSSLELSIASSEPKTTSKRMLPSHLPSSKRLKLCRKNHKLLCDNLDLKKVTHGRLNHSSNGCYECREVIGSYASSYACLKCDYDLRVKCYDKYQQQIGVPIEEEAFRKRRKGREEFTERYLRNKQEEKELFSAVSDEDNCFCASGCSSMSCRCQQLDDFDFSSSCCRPILQIRFTVQRAQQFSETMLR